MAHARRKIYDAQSNNEKLASYALQEIAKLYAIEQACHKEKLNEEQIKDRRSKESLPILKELGDWMKKEYQQLRPKSLIAQAFAYSIKRWEKLSLYAHTYTPEIERLGGKLIKV